MSGTVLILGRGSQWNQERVINGCALSGNVIGGFVSVIGAPKGNFLITSFWGLNLPEDIPIK